MQSETTYAATHNPVRAAMWMLGTIASFSAMAVAGREVSFQLDTFEIMMYRSFIGFLTVLLVAGYAGTLGQVRTDRIGTHFMRNISHFTGQNLWFFALALIPFAQLFAFEFSVPLWITLFAPLVLSERLTRTRVTSVMVGFIGILMVTRPWMAGLSWGIVAAFLCAIGFAGSAMFTKMLTRYESITGILFWLTLMQAGFGVICAGYDGDVALPSSDTWGWIVLIGFAGLLAHFCLTNALSVAPAVIVMPMDFTRLPIIAAIGAIFYAEAMNVWIILGAVVIFSANYFNILAERRAKAPQPVLATMPGPLPAGRPKTD
jgi:drug/metabolite transporter (DMT)-like permease